MDFFNSIKSVLVKMFRLSNWTKWEQIVLGCTITFAICTLITAISLIGNPDDPLRKIAYWMSFALYIGCVVAALLLFGRRLCASTQQDVAEESEIQTTAPRRSPASITTTAPKRGSVPITSVAPRRRSAPITIATPRRPSSFCSTMGPRRPRPSTRVTFEHERDTPLPYSARPFNPEEVSEPVAFGMFSSGVDKNRPLQHYLDRQAQMDAEEVEERVAQHERHTHENFLTRSSEQQRLEPLIDQQMSIDMEAELARQVRLDRDWITVEHPSFDNFRAVQSEYAREQLVHQERQQENNAASVNQDHTYALQNENFSNLVGSPPLRRNYLAEALEDEDRVRRDISSPTRDDYLD